MKPVLSPPKILHAVERDVPLLLKDAARDIRFTGKHVARQLVHQMLKDGQSAPPWAPPLSQIAQVAMQMLDNIDRAAVNLVAPAEDYRRKHFQLLSMGDTGSRSLLEASTRHFECNFYWVFKHLLLLAQRNDVTVHEKAIHQAGLAFHEAALQPVSGEPIPSTEVDLAQKIATLAQLLFEKRPLHVHAFLSGADAHPAASMDESTDTFILRMVIAAVLAGEVAAACRGSTWSEEVEQALQASILLATTKLTRFQRALTMPQPLKSLTSEFLFILQHL